MLKSPVTLWLPKRQGLFPTIKQVALHWTFAGCPLRWLSPDTLYVDMVSDVTGLGSIEKPGNALRSFHLCFWPSILSWYSHAFLEFLIPSRDSQNLGKCAYQFLVKGRDKDITRWGTWEGMRSIYAVSGNLTPQDLIIPTSLKVF